MRKLFLVLVSSVIAGAAPSAAQTPPPSATPPAPPKPPALPTQPAPRGVFRGQLSREMLEDLHRTTLERAHELQWELEGRLSHLQPEIEAKLADLQFHRDAMPALPPLPPLPQIPFEFDWFSGGGDLPEAHGALHRLRPQQGTPEDSLYRGAREALNRGEWARAASLFQSLEQKYPKSRVAPTALYYQAFALYRSGSSDQLRAAVEALKAQQQRYPEAAADPDAGALRTRLYAALAARGDAQAAAAVRAASATGPTCDEEEIAVRAEALNALAQLDPEGAAVALKEVLARRDECSVTLRRRAVYLLGRTGTEQATADLLEVVRNDPDPSVKSDAISLLGRSSHPSVTPRMLEQLFNESPDERTRQAVLSALRSRGGPEGRRALRGIIERTDLPERLRAQAISQLAGSSTSWVVLAGVRGAAGVVGVAPTPTPTPGARRAEPSLEEEDAAFLRALYSKTDSRTIKSAILSAVGRSGGPANEAWLLTIVSNPSEDSSLRREALSRLKGSAISIEELGKLFDALSDHELRSAVVSQLRNRDEAAATDKLINIAQSSTDPHIRSYAIQALSRKKDPKAITFIRELVEKP